jgi:hypothetical protein
LIRLEAANQRRLLHHWITRTSGQMLPAAVLTDLIPRIAAQRGPGQMDLPGGWLLSWDRSTLQLKYLNPSPLPPRPRQSPQRHQGQ